MSGINMNISNLSELYTILAVSQALLREITANMRSVSVIQIGNDLIVRFIFYSPPSEDEIEAMGYIGTEVIANFPAIETQSEPYEVVPIGQIDRKQNEHVVFERKPEELSSG